MQVEACKRNMNTFAFVGDLEKSPEVGLQQLLAMSVFVRMLPDT
jgi:Protein of unknown function (DUF3172)